MKNQLMREEEFRGKESFKVSRREILTAGGAALVGLTFSGSSSASVFSSLFGQDTFPGVTVVTGAKKPVYVPAMGSTDPVAHSLAEKLRI